MYLHQYVARILIEINNYETKISRYLLILDTL